MFVKITRSEDETMKSTGIALLFSAGTFLYVSTVNVLPELKRSEDCYPCPDMEPATLEYGNLKDYCHSKAISYSNVEVSLEHNAAAVQSDIYKKFTEISEGLVPDPRTNNQEDNEPSVSINDHSELSQPVQKKPANQTHHHNPRLCKTDDVVATDDNPTHTQQNFTKPELALLVFGCLCPLFTSLVHSH